MPHSGAARDVGLEALGNEAVALRLDAVAGRLVERRRRAPPAAAARATIIPANGHRIREHPRHRSSHQARAPYYVVQSAQA